MDLQHCEQIRNSRWQTCTETVKHWSFKPIYLQKLLRWTKRKHANRKQIKSTCKTSSWASNQSTFQITTFVHNGEHEHRVAWLSSQTTSTVSHATNAHAFCVKNYVQSATRTTSQNRQFYTNIDTMHTNHNKKYFASCTITHTKTYTNIQRNKTWPLFLQNRLQKLHKQSIMIQHCNAEMVNRWRWGLHPITFVQYLQFRMHKIKRILYIDHPQNKPVKQYDTFSTDYQLLISASNTGNVENWQLLHITWIIMLAFGVVRHTCYKGQVCFQPPCMHIMPLNGWRISSCHMHTCHRFTCTRNPHTQKITVSTVSNVFSAFNKN